MTTTQRCECLCLRTAHHNSGPCRNCPECDGWAPMVELPYDSEDET